MNYLKFKNPNTGDESYVNLDNLDNVRINAEKKTVSVCPDHGIVLEANLDEFEKAIKDSPNPFGDLVSVLRRLCDKLDRLVVHIPSSIRLHI